MSSDNLFYRYFIAGIQDLSETTFLRRKTKAAQNHRKSFFFELDTNFADIDLVCDFLQTNLAAHDAVLVPSAAFARLQKALPSATLLLQISSQTELNSLPNSQQKLNLFFNPRTSPELKNLVEFAKNGNEEKFLIFWRFSPYDPELRRSITVKDISSYKIRYNTLPGLEIHNTRIPEHYELEPSSNSSYQVEWTFERPNSSPQLSIIIPSFNNVGFLSNVLWHLLNQNCDRSLYEIIVVDDGGEDNSSTLIYHLFENLKDQINLRFIFWKKKNLLRGDQYFFRPGLARNLASRYSRAPYLFFLDSDMLVPDNFVNTCLEQFKNHDVLQFQRFHIRQHLSRSSPHYRTISLKRDTYIEESHYWSELFFCRNWHDLPNYWKYTCTYSLGLSKAHFQELGQFKKYYVSYGFEDTDLGYEAHLRKLRFKLVQVPLLHLTSYDQMQYKNSFSRRFRLLRTTAELFFLQHLNQDIYGLLGNYYRAQKPLKSFLRDLF